MSSFTRSRSQTEFGERLLENFCRLARSRRAGARRPPAARPPLARALPPPPASKPRRLELVVRSVRRPPDPETAFVRLFGAEPNAFWLDSARHGAGLARFSYMGAGGGPLSALLSHDVAAAELTLARRGQREVHRSGLFDWLDRSLARFSVEDRDLPFDFTGGFVGYLGYELKAECGSALVHHSPHPDAMLLFADRLIAYDQAADEAHVICLTEARDRGEAAAWADQTAARLRVLRAVEPPVAADSGGHTTFSLRRPADDYLRDIERCQEYLAAGESYEICLTNELGGPPCADALGLHRVLRRVNPAPFAAFLRLGGIEVSSSSPERFLALDRSGGLEAKPIKGTVARGATEREDREAAARLRSGSKDRAENLMIVDVLRNDLGRVAEIGSVRVPRLMGVESYATVHQLVSTVRARLRSDATIVDCLRASFPGGSMTGAPKARTMEIIDRLETRPRGIYSGAIGYLGGQRQRRPEHRDPHDRQLEPRDDDRRRRRDHRPVRSPRRGPRTAAQGPGAARCRRARAARSPRRRAPGRGPLGTKAGARTRRPKPTLGNRVGRRATPPPPGRPVTATILAAV